MSGVLTRDAVVADAMADVRAIDRAGVDRSAIEAIRERLQAMAAHRELFSVDDFPPPGPDEEGRSCLYRLSQDDDDRLALYVQSTTGGVAAPPHDHTTWAVIVGFDGQELNKRYDRRAGEGAPEVVSEFMVEAGTGIAFLADEVHSIHVDGPAMNFHCYGLALERLAGRRFWKAGSEEWVTFPAHSDIREARARAS